MFRLGLNACLAPQSLDERYFMEKAMCKELDFNIDSKAFNRYSVYVLIMPSNECYIGATSRKPQERWRNGEGYKTSKELYSRIQRYGWDNIQKRVLINELSLEQANRIEKYVISKFRENGFKILNKKDGGDGFNVAKEESKKLTIHESECPIINQETLSAVLSAPKNHSSKPVLCVETGIAYASTVEASEMTGINKATIRNCCNGRRSTGGGYHWQFIQKEHKKLPKQNIARRRVRCIDTGIVFNTITEAYEITGIDKTSISHACNGRVSVAGGYSWEFVDNPTSKGNKKSGYAPKSVKCIETGKVYSSAYEAVNELFPNDKESRKEIKAKLIREVCNKLPHHITALKLHWEYA